MQKDQEELCLLIPSNYKRDGHRLQSSPQCFIAHEQSKPWAKAGASNPEQQLPETAEKEPPLCSWEHGCRGKKKCQRGKNKVRYGRVSKSRRGCDTVGKS